MARAQTARALRPRPRRAPLPEAIPRPVKRATTRTSPERVTAHIRVTGASLTWRQHKDIRRKLGMKLGKYASSIERISVRVADVNGPKGGVDQRCRVKVVLMGLPSIVVARQDAVAQVAIDAALRATAEAVSRVLGRRREKPLRQA